jgi:hypothetical protein
MGWITNIFLKQFSVAYKILGKYKINLWVNSIAKTDYSLSF